MGKARQATSEDAAAIARIYNQGIEERIATFETRLRTPEEITGWLGSPYPVVVVEAESGEVAAFAAVSRYRDRECYEGVAEFSVYVDRGSRRRGFGRTAMEAMIEGAQRAGCWKLLSRIFVENDASRKLMQELGFREVGIYQRHAKLDGQWRDVVIVEKLLGE